LRILNVVGARPNLIKIAALVQEMQRFPEIEPTLLHTGQHYDDNMSQVFFDELGLPAWVWGLAVMPRLLRM
jgi:UDP-N-acetylglucosamine 2-epimerase